MMRKLMLLALAGCLLAVTASASLEGAWTATLDAKNPDRVYLNLTRGPHHSNGSMYRVSELSGVTAAQIQTTTRTDAQFELRREAGTIAFEGSFRNGRGAGQFTFTPSPTYVAALRKLNLRIEDLDDDDSAESIEEHQFFFASLDVSTEFIRAMQAAGFPGDMEAYMQMRLFGVSPERVREMRALGIKDLDTEKVIQAGIHGVTADYVRRARAMGWNVSLEKLIETRIHGATPEFAEEIRKLGYANVPVDDLIQMRIHGVDAKFIRDLAEAGYHNVPIEKMVEMKIHGIDARYIRRMNDAQ